MNFIDLKDLTDKGVKTLPFDTYIGIGNTIAFNWAGRTAEAIIVDRNTTSVEVALYDAKGQRFFHWVRREHIQAVNGQLVVWERETAPTTNRYGMWLEYFNGDAAKISVKGVAMAMAYMRLGWSL